MLYLRFLFAFAFCCASIFPSCASPAPSSTKVQGADAANITRITADISIFDLKDLMRSPEQAWVVAGIKPQVPNGGSSNAYVDSATGKLVVAPNGFEYVTLGGTFRVVATLASPVKKTVWMYNLILPIHDNFGVRSSSPEVRLMAFYRGGVAIFRIVDTQDNPQSFDPVYLIPEEWATLVGPALKYCKTHPKVFLESKVLKNQNELRRDLLSSNPFIEIAAYRTLSANQTLRKQYGFRPIAAATGFRQGILLCIALKNISAREETAAGVTDYIDKAKNTAELEGITIGLVSSLREWGLSDSDRALYLSLLRKLVLRQTVLTSQNQQKDFITNLIANAQVFK